MKTPSLLLFSAFVCLGSSATALAGPIFHHGGPRVVMHGGFGYGHYYPGHYYSGYSGYSGYYRPYYRDSYYYPGIALAAALTVPAILYASRSYPVSSYSSETWVSVPSGSYDSNYGSSYQTSYTVSSPDYYSESQAPVSTGTVNGSQDWLYCDHPDGFYPAIKNCPSGWRRVASQGR